MAEPKPYGIIARFEGPEALVKAARAAREAGYQSVDAHAPFPVPGLSQALGFRERSIPVIALACGVIGAAVAFFMQWYSAVIDYPIVVGGKPLNSWPAFLPITFEVGVLSAVLSAVIAMIVSNGLPRPYHPVFNDAEFDRASGDGFFLVISGELDTDTVNSIKVLLSAHAAVGVRELAP